MRCCGICTPVPGEKGNILGNGVCGKQQIHTENQVSHFTKAVVKSCCPTNLEGIKPLLLVYWSIIESYQDRMFPGRTNLQYIILVLRITRFPMFQFLECFGIIVESISLLAIHGFAVFHNPLLTIESRPAVTILAPDKKER